MGTRFKQMGVNHDRDSFTSVHTWITEGVVTHFNDWQFTIICHYHELMSISLSIYTFEQRKSLISAEMLVLVTRYITQGGSDLPVWRPCYLLALYQHCETRTAQFIWTIGPPRLSLLHMLTTHMNRMSIFEWIASNITGQTKRNLIAFHSGFWWTCDAYYVTVTGGVQLNKQSEQCSIKHYHNVWDQTQRESFTSLAHAGHYVSERLTWFTS